MKLPRIYAKEKDIEQSLADGKLCDHLRNKCVIIYSCDEDMPSKLAALEGFFTCKWLFVLRNGTEWKPAPQHPKGGCADFLYGDLDNLSEEEREAYLFDEIDKYAEILSFYHKLVKGQSKACGSCLWETESKTCEKCGSKTFPKDDMDWACVNCGKPGKIGLNFGKLCESCDYGDDGHW